jgi:hypothetical protein
MKTISYMFLAALLSSHAGVALAERSVSYGDYVIHYNALTTDIISPSVARTYGITRSKNRALINVSVLHGDMGVANRPISATVTGTATNLTAQLHDLNFRQAGEGGAVYYIAETRVGNQETLRFRIEVTPDGEDEPHLVEFEQQFFTD